MPQPRLTNQLARIGESDNSQGSRVTLEAVEAVQGHLVTILGGLRVPCADIQALVGDMVHVEWNAGRPVRVIDFEVRRGSVFFTTHVVGKSVIEELFIADFTDPVTKVKKKDVYFRNLQQITRLKVNDFTGGAEPGLVIWGMNDDVFAVRDAASATRFHVFRLNRPANQTGKSLHKVYGSRPAKIAAKLYTADLQDNSLTLTTITAKFRRDSIEPVFGLLSKFHLEGFGDSFFPYSGTGFGNDFGGALFGTNTNIASVDRVVRVKLTGLTASVEGVTVPASECVVQTGGDPPAPVVTAALVDFMVDENDELLVSVQVKFDGFGIKQGNPTTGLTGDRKGVGPGAFKNFGFLYMFNQYPFIVDDFGVQDFNGHGNVGGVLSTDTTEAHSILMKARG